MKKYHKKMPWPTINFESASRGALKSKFGGDSIPGLVLLDEHGQVVSHSHVGKKYVGPTKVLQDLGKKL